MIDPLTILLEHDSLEYKAFVKLAVAHTGAVFILLFVQLAPRSRVG